MRKIKVAIDCDVSYRLAAVLSNAFGDRGFEFIHVSQFMPSKHDDEHWADLFARFGGAVTISADSKIAKTPHKQMAFVDNGFLSFFLQPPWSSAPGNVKAAHLLYWWPIIEERVAEKARGECWQVPFVFRNGTLSLRRAEFKRLKVPENVLDGLRRAKVSDENGR